MDDSCVSSFQLLGSLKKKKKNKLGKPNREMNEQSVNPSLHPSISSDPSSIFAGHVDCRVTEDNQTQQEKSRSEGKDNADDSCTSSFQLLHSIKKKKRKNKLRKLNRGMNKHSVNPSLHSSFFSEPSSVFPLHVDRRDTEDNQTQQQKARSEGKDNADDSCTSSFQLLHSIKKKKKRKNKLRKLNWKMKKQSSLHSCFFSEPSSVFPSYVYCQDTEDNEMQQQKSKRCKKGTRKTPDSQVENSSVLKESKLPHAVGTVTLNKKRKRKYRFIEQDGVNECHIPETPEEASSLPEAEYLEEEGGSCEITTKKKKKKEVAKILSEDELLVKETMEAGGKYANLKQYHMLQKSPLSGCKDETGSSSKAPISKLVTLKKEFLDSSGSPMQNLRTITQELKEFISHARTHSDSVQKEEGISGRFDRFSKEEDVLLRKNIEAFLEESGISNAEKLLFTNRFPEEKADLTRLKCDHFFGLKIAKGIQRPWSLIYYRAREMFDPQHYNKKGFTCKTMSGKARARGKVHGQETTVSNFGAVTEMTDKVDDSCDSSFQLLDLPKKKKKRKNKLEKLNKEMNKQSVNPSLHSSFFSEPSSVFDLHVDSQDTEDIQTQQEKSRSKGKDNADDSCAGSLELLGSIKKKKKRKNKLEKLNKEMDEQSVNPTLCSPFFSEPSSVFALHVDHQDTEDNQTQQQKARSEGKDNPNDSCNGSFQLLGSVKKGKKRKNKLGKLDKKMNEQSVNPSLRSSFFSEPSSVFPLHVDCQDAEDNQTQQQKSKRCKKGTRETPDTQLENHWVVKESNLDHAVGTVTLKKKRKRKHWSIKQDGINECFIAETPEEASSLPEADPLEEVGGSCEITTMKKEEEKQVITKKASVGRPDFANDLKETQDYIFVSSSQAPPKTQDVDFLQNKIGGKLSIPDPSARLSSSTAQPSVSSPTGNSDATKDSFLVKNTLEAVGNHDNSQQYHMLQKSPLSGHTDDILSSSRSPISEPPAFPMQNVEFPGFPMQKLETITRELEEFIPHVRALSDSSIKQLATRDLARFKHFKKQGISVRFGRFSKQENEMLKKNMEAFLQETGINSAEKVLFTDRFPEEQADINRLKRDCLFGLKIAEGIPRPWRLVYYRAKKMFDPWNYNGKYSKDEKKKLKKYQARFGNDWKKMSELMNRSSRSLHLKYDEMKSKFNSGAWSKEETKKLLHTLKEILWAKVEGLDSTLEPKNTDQAMLLRKNLYKGIPWFQVEAKVGTRRWKQCKKKWLYFVTKKMSQGKMRNHGLENLKFKIDLIERLHELDVEDIDDVNWEDLSRTIGNAPPDYVRNRFYKIKTLYVPYWNKKTFPETIDYLHKEILPKLRSKVAGGETKELATADRNWKRVFKFNEIFQDDDDLIDEEEEEEEEEEDSLRGSASE